MSLPADLATAMEAAHGPMRISGNAMKVLEKRYLQGDSGTETPSGMCTRVALNVASAEAVFPGHGEASERIAEAAGRFYRMMASLEFLPNSPTLMNAGRSLQQLSACFVLPVEDSISGIFEAVKNAAIIHKSGGGTGFSFSRLRPANSKVATTNGVSSGPISFMQVFDAATESIKQGGKRRGANMGILRVDHPDVEAFISCKDDKSRLNNFNLSVGLTDAFMQALSEDGEYDLVNPKDGRVEKTLPAKSVFSAIAEHAWRTGEPGIVFLDRMNAANPTPSAGIFEATNPCGEQPLLPYESCNLGSINLGKFVLPDGTIDTGRLEAVVYDAVRFLDNVVEVNAYPLPEIDRVTKSNRKIGLGVMGFADALAAMGIPYDSGDAERTAREVMSFIQATARKASCALAEERGSFPNFEDSVFPGMGYRAMRNATVTTIAPTGTISIIAGVSSGIEPMFALSYVRNVMAGTKMLEGNEAFISSLREAGADPEGVLPLVSDNHGSCAGLPQVPGSVQAAFRTAHDVSPEWHIRIQAAFQEHVDNAVSKTVNLPSSATVDDVRNVYVRAYESGCKGVTVYRDGSRDEQVLSAGSAPKEVSPAAPPEAVPAYAVPRERAATLSGTTRQIRTGCGSIYVTVNRDEKGVFEVFAQIGKAGGCAASQTEAIGRLASMALRSGVDPAQVVKQMSGISCHVPHGFGKARVLSCADAIGQALAQAVESGAATTAVPETPARQPEIAKEAPAGKPLLSHRGACPDCGGQLRREEGCVKCACGFSEC